MNKILILFAHPSFAKSRINAALRAQVEFLQGVTFHDLYACYPDFLIDVAHEQRLCEEHDIIILQHPLYWYSVPALQKEWFDYVLQHGWAYGSSGKALEGKGLLEAITAGGDSKSYRQDGFNRFTLEQITTPLQATANLCRMRWLAPFTVLGIHRGLDERTIETYANRYRDLVIALRDGTSGDESQPVQAAASSTR